MFLLWPNKSYSGRGIPNPDARVIGIRTYLEKITISALELCKIAEYLEYVKFFGSRNIPPDRDVLLEPGYNVERKICQLVGIRDRLSIPDPKCRKSARKLLGAH